MMQVRKWLPLVVIGVVLVLLCVLAWHLSESTIADRKAKLLTAVITRTLPVAYDNIPYLDTVALNQENIFSVPQPNLKAYLLRRQGALQGAVFMPVSSRGYSGTISLAVGIHDDGTVAGISVLSHRETSGIGAEATTAAFTGMMQGKSLSEPPLSAWAVRPEGGDFDHVSGATVSSSAMVMAVRDCLRLFSSERHSFVEKP
ncbi:MAG: RnfABCDGE type electron transport complex subunit G [Candidatus Porifericomitaceae bacterium WSBS_2022_MAG_OTU9]